LWSHKSRKSTTAGTTTSAGPTSSTRYNQLAQLPSPPPTSKHSLRQQSMRSASALQALSTKPRWPLLCRHTSMLLPARSQRQTAHTAWCLQPVLQPLLLPWHSSTHTPTPAHGHTWHTSQAPYAASIHTRQVPAQACTALLLLAGTTEICGHHSSSSTSATKASASATTHERRPGCSAPDIDTAFLRPRRRSKLSTLDV
jgi:hypothetical protein